MASSLMMSREEQSLNDQIAKFITCDLFFVYIRIPQWTARHLDMSQTVTFYYCTLLPARVVLLKT